MRRACVLFTILVAGALAAAPAAATSVTVQISGTWNSVTDTAGVLDGSITVGGTFTATLVYDDGIAANPENPNDPNSAGYDISAAASDLTFVSGNYSFVPSSGLGITIDNDVGGEDGVFLFAESYVTTGPLPPGISTGGISFANPALTDSTGTAHGSDLLTALPWSIGSYDLTDFYFFTEVFGAEEGDFIELDGTITDLEILPEPSTLVLVGLGIATLLRARIRV